MSTAFSEVTTGNHSLIVLAFAMSQNVLPNRPLFYGNSLDSVCTKRHFKYHTPFLFFPAIKYGMIELKPKLTLSE